MKIPRPDKLLDGQESVWTYPRPPSVEQVNQHVRIVFNGVLVAETGSPVLVKGGRLLLRVDHFKSGGAFQGGTRNLVVVSRSLRMFAS